MLATTLDGRHLRNVIISTNCDKDDTPVVFSAQSGDSRDGGPVQ